MLYKNILAIVRFDDLSPLHWIIIVFLFIAVHIPAIWVSSSKTNDYEVLARSICSGRVSLSVDDIPYLRGTTIKNTGDLVYFDGKYYLPYPPAPVILVLPWVLLGFGHVNCVIIAVFVGAFSLLVARKLLCRAGVSSEYIPWLLYGFFFGTSYWYVLMSSHDVYQFAQVVAVLAVLLLLAELFGKRRAGLLGLYLSMAFLCRQLTVFLSIFVAGYFFYVYFLKGRQHMLFWRKISSFLAVVIAGIAIYCVYNYIRFGAAFDTGYDDIIFLGALKVRVLEHGVFSLSYLPYNLYNYLFKGFNIVFTGEDMLRIEDVDLYGSALLIASPFLLASFKTGLDSWILRFAWIAIVLIFFTLLLYHNNGKDQVNASRFTLDFLPLMLVLTGHGADKFPKWLFRSMVVYSIVINLIAFSVHFIFHTFENSL